MNNLCNKLRKRIMPVFMLAACFMLMQCAQKKSPELNPELFKNPPKEYGVHTWWHWLDNAISKEGITADLEAMHAQGIVTATILNVGLHGERDLGVPQIKFGTPEWFDMFKWALTEANRLGIKIGVHNCDGWSTSGGPWITPEMSMKQTTWSIAKIKGGGKIEMTLAKPAGERNFYRDVAVVACKLPEKESIGQIAPNKILVNGKETGNSICDGNPISGEPYKEGDVIEMQYEKPVSFSAITLHLRKKFSWRNLAEVNTGVEFKTSSNGLIFKPVANFTNISLNANKSFQVNANGVKAIQLVIKKFNDNEGYSPAFISEVSLTNGNAPLYNTSIPFHLEKIATTQATNLSQLLISQSPDSSYSVKASEVVDLTSKMDTSGKLSWDAPEGNWTVIRFGYTTTGSVNGPATKSGTGLECDKMDTSALGLHFRNFPMQAINAAGNLKGKTFDYLFVDSWECGYQNWTMQFPDEFKKRRGYDITRFIPAICGVVVDNSQQTEGFFLDFQKTIAELIHDNYYVYYQQLCKQQGIKLHAEAIYGGAGYPPLDVLKCNTYASYPMFEFWAGADGKDKLVKYGPVSRIERDLPAYASILYNNPIVPAEAYTGFANYSETPWDLKLFGDRAMCTGVNRMVLHSYVHQPTENKPGITLGQFGQSFNRHNPMYAFYSEWFKYLSRAQYVLQQGQAFGNVLQWLGDNPYSTQPSDALNEIANGISRHLCNTEALANAKVENGSIALKNGLKYNILILPKTDRISLASLQCIEKLVNNGAVIYGEKPCRPYSNSDYKNDLEKISSIAAKMWGVKTDTSFKVSAYGKGKVMCGGNLLFAIKQVGVNPDFKWLSADSLNLLYYHKIVGKKDVYFVVNQLNKNTSPECLFQVTGKTVQLWDPETGDVSDLAIYSEQDGYTQVPLNLKPKQAVFVVFSDGQQDHISIVKKEKTQVFPSRSNLPEAIPVVYKSNNAYESNSLQNSNYEFVTTSGKTLNSKISSPNQWLIENLKAKIEFENGQVPVVETSKLEWLNNFADNAIKYYSGTAEYTISFKLPVGIDLQQGDSLVLEFENFASVCEVELNNIALGKAVFQGYQFGIAKGLLKQENELKVKVANNWRNRIIGNLAEKGNLGNLNTTAPIYELPTKDMPLSNFGLQGNVIIKNFKRQILN